MREVHSFEDKAIINDIPYLDISTLVECSVGKAIAYVSNCTSGMAKTNSGFMTFYLKDVHANVITARLFDVKDFLISGLTASAYKHNPVIVNYVVQSFNGKKSLIIDGDKGIELYHGDFDYTKFVGSFNCDNLLFPEIAKKWLHDTELPIHAYKADTFDGIGDGRAGAYCKVCDMALSMISAYDGLPGFDFNELMIVFFITTKYYHQILKLEAVYDNLSNLKILDMLNGITMQYISKNWCATLVETIQVLCKQIKPKSLIAHVISQAFAQAIWSLNAGLYYETLPIGQKSSYGGVELLKY